ncbi:hypothetical protein [Umezawaea beigongshangensis]|nr:hypothetical protein [Umezawaea beigongshangensis]
MRDQITTPRRRGPHRSRYREHPLPDAEALREVAKTEQRHLVSPSG